MVRNYKRKTDRMVSESSMNAAVIDIIKHGRSYRQTATKFNVKLVTLYQRVRMAKLINKNLPTPQSDTDSGSDTNDAIEIQSTSQSGNKKYSTRQVFNDTEEQQLKEYLKSASKMCYGLTYTQTRKLSYEYAVKINKKFPTSWEKNQFAGLDWIYGFMKRNKELTLRKPENTSLARALAFNRVNVDAFFKNLESVISRFNFSAEKIYNVDETGITTVLQSPKVISESGKRQVGQIVSAERGELVTFCGIINAVGNRLPPVFVFPRVKFKDQFLNGGPTSSLGLASRNGWMTVALFVDVLRHIRQHTNCTVGNPILLLLDNHISHTSIESISFAKENGIVILSFPPHCSHRLQPLDVSVYGPFKSALKISFNNHMASHPGKPITIYDIASLTRIPFQNSFSIKNIQSSFAKTGIWPLNSLIFTEKDFESSYVGDRPNPVANETDPTLVENYQTLSNTNQADECIQSSEVQQENLPVFDISCNDDNVAGPSTSILETVRPFPKAAARKTVKNKKHRAKSTVYTDTPEKKKLEERQEQKNKKPVVNKTKKRKINFKVRLSYNY